MDTNKHADLYLTARDVKRHGLATHIGLPRLATEVTITTEITVDDRPIRDPKIGPFRHDRRRSRARRDRTGALLEGERTTCHDDPLRA
jgi:hypothetical protein